MRRPLALFFLLGSLSFLSCAEPPRVEITDDNSDAAVSARVRQELRAHPGLNIQYLDLNVDNGLVTVSGIVDNVQQRDGIRKIIAGVAGVQGVVVNVLLHE